MCTNRCVQNNWWTCEDCNSCSCQVRSACTKCDNGLKCTDCTDYLNCLKCDCCEECSPVCSKCGICDKCAVRCIECNTCCIGYLGLCVDCGKCEKCCGIYVRLHVKDVIKGVVVVPLDPLTVKDVLNVKFTLDRYLKMSLIIF